MGAGGAGALGALRAGGSAGHALEASKTSSFLTKTKQREVGWALRVLWVRFYSSVGKSLAPPASRDVSAVPGMLPHLRHLAGRLPGHARACQSLHVYTDGPFLPGSSLNRAGWAFAVFTEFGWPASKCNGLGFLGYAGGSIRPWACSLLDVDYDCYDAECIALAVACASCLAVPARVPICVHFDATSAGYAAAGCVQPRRPSDSRSAAAFARYCAQALEAAGHQLQ